MANAARVEHAAVPCLTLAPPIEVLLVDDQRAILAGVAALIESEEPAMQVAARATCVRQALDLACSIQPDVIVLDVNLGGDDGLALIPPLLSFCTARIIVFTCLTDPEVRTRALSLGACEFVSKAVAGSALIAAIRKAMPPAG